jgi:peptidoglycan hydrolase-like protein with peptidoglycan-binding domain
MLVALSMLTPSITHASFFDDLRAQLSALRVQLDELIKQSEILSQTKTISTTPYSTSVVPIESSATSAAPSNPQGSGYIVLQELPNSPQVSCTLPELLPAEKKDEVNLLQIALYKAGYYKDGLITGYYGKLTEAAVRNFQSGNNLPVTGRLDRVSASKLDGSVKEYFEECRTTKDIKQIFEIPEPPVILPPQTTSTQSLITVIHPLAGYALDNSGGKDSGIIANIQWSSLNLGNYGININLINSNGSTFNGIASDIPNTGTYAWKYDSTIPNGSYQIQIASSEKGGPAAVAYSGYFSLSGNNFVTTTSTQPRIFSTYPGMVNVGDDTTQITLTGIGFRGDGSQIVSLTGRSNDGTGYDTSPNNVNVSSNGMQMTFTLPTSLKAGTYTIQIETIGGAIPNSNTTQIFVNPLSQISPVTITYPTAGMSFTAGGPITVAFTNYAIGSQYDVFLISNTYSTLLGRVTGKSADQDKESFTLASTIVAGSNYQIRISPIQGKDSANAYSPYFSIVTVTSTIITTSTTSHPHGPAAWNYGWDDFTSPLGADHSAQILENYRAHPEEYGVNPIGNNGYVPNPVLYGASNPKMPTAVLRLYKACSDNWINRKEHIPVEPGGYMNYRCTNRYQQQCFDDGSFDSYYDEACIYESPVSAVPSTNQESLYSASVFNAAKNELQHMVGQLKTLIEKSR